jgi:polyphenol oxidase
MSFQWGSAKEVIANRTSFLQSRGLQLSQCVCVKTVDQDLIYRASIKDTGKGTTSLQDAVFADALVTTESELPLFLLTADCLPLVLFDPKHQVIGLAHLSRKSATQQLAAKLVQYFQQHFQSDISSLRVVFGPSITKDSYSFSLPLTEKPDNSWDDFSNVSEKNISFDLQGYVALQLKQVGVDEKHISLLTENTAASENFFSHYRAVRNGEQEGRFATVVMLKNQSHNHKLQFHQ